MRVMGVPLVVGLGLIYGFWHALSRRARSMLTRCWSQGDGWRRAMEVADQRRASSVSQDTCTSCAGSLLPSDVAADVRPCRWAPFLLFAKSPGQLMLPKPVSQTPIPFRGPSSRPDAVTAVPFCLAAMYEQTPLVLVGKADLGTRARTGGLRHESRERV